MLPFPSSLCLQHFIRRTMLAHTQIISPTGTDFQKNSYLLFTIFSLMLLLLLLHFLCNANVWLKWKWKTNVRITYVSSQIIYLLPYSMIHKHSYLFTSLPVLVYYMKNSMQDKSMKHIKVISIRRRFFCFTLQSIIFCTDTSTYGQFNNNNNRVLW